MRFFINAHMVANMCSDTLWPYAPLALVTMVPRGSTPADVRIHTGAEGLQPFKTGVLGSLRDRKVADDCGSSGAKLLGNSGRPDHVAAVRFVAHEFLRHIASRLGESPPFSFVEWQAVDNQLMRVLNTHGSPN